MLSHLFEMYISSKYLVVNGLEEQPCFSRKRALFFMKNSPVLREKQGCSFHSDLYFPLKVEVEVDERVKLKVFSVKRYGNEGVCFFFLPGDKSTRQVNWADKSPSMQY